MHNLAFRTRYARPCDASYGGKAIWCARGPPYKTLNAYPSLGVLHLAPVSDIDVKALEIGTARHGEQ